MTPLIQNSETGESNGGTGEGGGREWGEDSEDEWDENGDDESGGGVAASREEDEKEEEAEGELGGASRGRIVGETRRTFVDEGEEEGAEEGATIGVDAAGGLGLGGWRRLHPRVEAEGFAGNNDGGEGRSEEEVAPAAAPAEPVLAGRGPAYFCPEQKYEFTAAGSGWVSAKTCDRRCKCGKASCPDDSEGATEAEHNNFPDAPPEGKTRAAADPLRGNHEKNIDYAAGFGVENIEAFPLLQLWLRVIPFSEIAAIVGHTNAYANEYVLASYTAYSNGEGQRRRPQPASAPEPAVARTPRPPTNTPTNPSTPRLTKRATAWLNLTVPELIMFWSINMLSTVNIRKNMAEYWEKDDDIGVPEIARRMSRKRFQDLAANLKISNNKEDPKMGGFNGNKQSHRRAVKFWDLQSVVLQNVPKLFEFEGRYYALDESMIGWRGNLSFRVFQPDKPTKHGIKAYMICDSETGAFVGMEIYTGGEGEDVENDDEQLGKTDSVVNRLIPKSFDNKGKVIVTDNYYTRVFIMTHLAKNRKIGMLGTTKHPGGKMGPTNVGGRTKFPFLDKLTPAQCKRVFNGYCRTAVQVENGSGVRIAATVWKDKNWVRMLHSVLVRGRLEDEIAARKTGASKIVGPCHGVVNAYNKHMGAVDRFDRLLSEQRGAAKSKRWWMRVMDFLLNIVSTQVYLFVRNKRPVPSHQMYPKLPSGREHTKFRVQLQREMADMARALGYTRAEEREKKKGREGAGEREGVGEGEGGGGGGGGGGEGEGEGRKRAKKIHALVNVDKRSQCSECRRKATSERRISSFSGGSDKGSTKGLHISKVGFVCNGEGCHMQFFCRPCWSDTHVK